MDTQRARQKWFPCFCPDGLIARQDAVDLIYKHAAKARIFEDLGGNKGLLVAHNGAQRLVLFSELTDAQITEELPTAWVREHQQRDMFRDAALAMTNDECHAPKQPGPWPLPFLHAVWRWFR